MNPSTARPLEHTCQRCGRECRPFMVESPLWNEVMRGGSIDGPWRWQEIICPACFQVLAEEQGVVTTGQWRLVATEVAVPLQTVTPSGRTWNADTWLWERP